jgi:hypothetical protein
VERISTGLPGFDRVIDDLRLGDNVVWQVECIEDYRRVTEPYVRQARRDGRRLVYVRFGAHPPLLAPGEADDVCVVDAQAGFESFAAQIRSRIEQEGLRAFYLFDCLSDLLESWYSDLMIGNFFRVTCPRLFQLDTVAYFALRRGLHTHGTVARIRETTQLLLDLHCLRGHLYIHPLKVWERYSPTMFFPHLIRTEDAVSVTASAEAAELFTGAGVLSGDPRDPWALTLERARAALTQPDDTRAAAKELLIRLVIGREARIAALSRTYFALEDLLAIASREIGSGFIGGKSVGMLLARKILETDAGDALAGCWEPHDSFYLGSDVFYTYIVQNGWWELRTRQKTPEGYFALAPELRANLLRGRFPDAIREQFVRMLEHFGQSPIIVRSSSLQEDNFGNAFAGKYDSVFCANQGPLEARREAFEQAVRTVFASTMNEDALAYRLNRNLTDRDEQMAILIQRVSGDHYGTLFFPHTAGVGHSSNLYVWDRAMDPSAGMLRLVFGLGTRAVDRVSGDYARLVPLDDPTNRPPVSHGDEKKFSQHRADVLDLRENRMGERRLDELLACDLKTDPDIFFSVDEAAQARLRALGRPDTPAPRILDFRTLLEKTRFPALARTVLATLAKAYDYPVDIEFTANFDAVGGFRFNLLQCRPLQTKGLGRAVRLPTPAPEEILLASDGHFMGGNTRTAFDYVLLVHAPAYLALPERDKHAAARRIGDLNRALQGHSVLLIGPGRWGTTTPSLGVPVHFNEISHMAAICEVSYRQGEMTPELSFGSHFFQDIVEAGMVYAAIFDGAPGVVFQPERVTAASNRLCEVLEDGNKWESVLHLAHTPGLTLYTDIRAQKLLCCGGPARAPEETA